MAERPRKGTIFGNELNKIYTQVQDRPSRGWGPKTAASMKKLLDLNINRKAAMRPGNLPDTQRKQRT